MAAKKSSGSGKGVPQTTDTRKNKTQVERMDPKTKNAQLANKANGKVLPSSSGGNQRWDSYTGGKKGGLTGSRASSVAMSNRMSGRGPAGKGGAGAKKK